MRTPRFGIVASRFNSEITDRLLENCLRTLRERGVGKAAIRVLRVPGAYEIPWAAQELARSRRFDAVICLGAILKGGTPQNDYISDAVIHAVQRIALETRTPCILGIIVPNTWKQAVERTRGGMDRGRESALAALEMAGLKGSL